MLFGHSGLRIFYCVILFLLLPVVMISTFNGKMTTMPEQPYVELKEELENADDRGKRLVRTHNQHHSIALE